LSLVYGYNICVIVWLLLFCLILIYTTCLYPDITKHKWSWLYGSWIYNYLCNQCLSPLMLWVQISIRARCTTLCNKVCQWLETGGFLRVYPTNKSDITEILLKVASNTIKQTKKHIRKQRLSNPKTNGLIKLI
jgi:hypothetical protein